MLGMTNLIDGRAKAARRAALLAAALAALAAGGMRTAAASDCTGPLRQCLIEIGAICERTATGQRIQFYDTPARVARYEECVGKLYEANGRPNPYKTGLPQQSAAQPAPKSKR
jgi:hypothetical protein